MSETKSIVVTYSTNNSGGSWWLKDKDWIELERNGWDVQWGGLDFCNSRYRYQEPRGLPVVPCATDACKGHKRFRSHTDMTNADRFLGSLANYASKAFEDPLDAIREFEQVTGQDASAEGCNCCGAPHSFEWKVGDDSEYVSGAGIAELLTGSSGLSYRAALERIRELEDSK